RRPRAPRRRPAAAVHQLLRGPQGPRVQRRHHRAGAVDRGGAAGAGGGVLPGTLEGAHGRGGLLDGVRVGAPPREGCLSRYPPAGAAWQRRVPRRGSQRPRRHGAARAHLDQPQEL
ncbi:unnamed protein product, partial [Prorocentrum cordatum]